MNLFKGLKPDHKPSKNGFDLSQKHVFSSKPGQLIPCLSVDTVPGDHFEIDMASLTRTETLYRPASVRGKFNFDFYFVPYTQIWHSFNQMITQKRDRHATVSRSSAEVPKISLSWVLEQIFSWYIMPQIHVEDIHNINAAFNALRLLDMLGYGAWYNIFDYDDVDDLRANFLDTIFDGYGTGSNHAYRADTHINIFRIAAYQHIWYDVYRNKYFDTADEYVNGEDSFNTYVNFFNFDDISCQHSYASNIEIAGNSSMNINPIARLIGMLNMRYVQYKKDLFTSLMPSQQFGAVSAVDVSFDLVKRPGSNYYATTVSNGGTPLVDGGSGSLTASLPDGVDSVNLRLPSAFDVLTLRKAEMLQLWKQNALRAGNMTDDNFKAHFGVEPYYENDENVHYLGSYSAPLNINPVEQTSPYASGSSQMVGDLGAKATAVAKGSKIKFDCKDFGVIMCVQYFQPENDYEAVGIDKHNTLIEPFDFFTPEFENIGLEAVPMSAYNMSNPDLNTTYPVWQNLRGILGYAPRYYAYKTALDKVHGNFIAGIRQAASMRAWVAPRHESFVFDSNSKIPIKNVARTLQSFYVSPDIFDSIFAVAADDRLNSDCFINDVYFDVKAIRPMSVLGLPTF